MAKPIEGHAGNAMHIHQSVVDINSGENIFSDAKGEPTTSQRVERCGRLCQHEWVAVGQGHKVGQQANRGIGERHRCQRRQPGGVEIGAPLPSQHAAPQAEAAERLAAFWDRAYTEYNVAKTMSFEQAGATGVRQRLGTGGEKHVRSPESISHEAHAHCLLGTPGASGAEGDRCWGKLVDILEGCSRTPRGVLRAELIEPGSASSEARRARARHRFVAALTERVNMYDLHKPCAVGPPAKDQPCGRVDDESAMGRASCKKLSPR